MATLLIGPLSGGCALENSGDRPGSGLFSFADIAKTDVNLILEVHQQEVMGHLRALMEKLYRRNPVQLQRGQSRTREESLERVFGSFHNWIFPELDGVNGEEAIRLAFRESFQGDRVLAFTVGLGSMIMASFNDKREFFVLDSLDAQKLYNCARNLEVAAWMLAQSRDAQGELFLLSNQLDGESPNLSFERMFGKMIGLQDAIAEVVAQKTKRMIKQALQFLIFLPI